MAFLAILLQGISPLPDSGALKELQETNALFQFMYWAGGGLLVLFGIVVRVLWKELQEKYISMVKDRDYWRSRANDLEKQNNKNL